MYYRLSSHELFFLIGEGQMTYVTDTTSGSFLQDKVSGTHHREQTLCVWVCVCVYVRWCVGVCVGGCVCMRVWCVWVGGVCGWVGVIQ